jgi:copper chaperone CopZ
MKTAFFLIATLLTISLNAQQVTKVSLQASGLTCSMCSNSINKSLRTIDFVQKVEPNVQTSTFVITFKPDAAVDFDQLKKKVEDAGFFVSNFIATINFNSIEVKPNEPVKLGDKTFHFVGIKTGSLNGEMPVKILNKGFVSSKEFKKNSFTSTTGAKIYYATI